MEAEEYKNNEKVLDKYKVKLKDETEEVDCIVTEDQLVIYAEEAIRLPLSHIVNCDVNYPLPSVMYSNQPSKQRSGTATLTYHDELNKKQKLSLEMSAGSITLFKQSIIKQKAKQEPMEENYHDIGIGPLAKAGGILNIISANIILYIGIYLIIDTLSSVGLAGGEIIFLLFISIMGAVFAALPLVGGLYALQQRKWSLTFAGSIVACFFMPLLGLPAMILTVLSRKDLPKGERRRTIVVFGLPSGAWLVIWSFMAMLIMS